MSYQTIVKRGTSLKRGGIGFVGAGVLAVVTACSAGLPPVPVVAPAPTTIAIRANPVRSLLAVSTPTTAPQLGSVRPLEIFRYSGQPSLIGVRPATASSREFFRYSGQPELTVATAGSARPLEMFRYTPASAATLPAPGAKRPVEFFRYTGPPRLGGPLPL